MHLLESFTRKPALTAAWLRWNWGRRESPVLFSERRPKMTAWCQAVSRQSVCLVLFLALNNSGKASRFRNSCMDKGSGDLWMLCYFDTPHPWALFLSFQKCFCYRQITALAMPMSWVWYARKTFLIYIYWEKIYILYNLFFFIQMYTYNKLLFIILEINIESIIY